MAKPDDTDDKKDLDDASKVQDVVETALKGDPEDENIDDQEDDKSGDDSAEEESENKDDSDDSDESEDDKKSDDDEESDSEDKSGDDDSAERKFKNLAADDDATYIKNIERAYENSSAEALRLNTELGNMGRRVDAIIAAAQKDPDLAKKLNEVLGTGGSDNSSGTDNQSQDSATSPKPTDDPFLIDSKTKWEQKSREEVEAILAANPEINSDPNLNSRVKHWMEVFSNEEFKNNRRLMSGGEAMEAAMKHLNIEDKRQKQNVANGVKSLAAPTRPTKSRTPKPKAGKGLTDAAAEFADKLGVAREKAEKYAQQ